jgi:hypothetical protein
MPTATSTPTPTATPTPTEAPPLGFQAYWTLDQISGLRLDSSGRGNHLTDNNTVGSFLGQVGLAADLERDNREYLSISDAAQDGLDIVGSLTLAGWMNPESLNGWQILAAKYDWGTNNRGYRFDVRAPNLLGFIVSPDGTFDSTYLLEANLPFSLSVGTWYHVAAVFDADQRMLLVYLNGDLVASRSVNYNSIHDSTAAFMLGANQDSGSVTQYFDGQLDEWRVYSRALSESEIEDLIAPPDPTPTPTATSTPVPSATPTATETSTPTETPTDTLTPTATLAPTETSTPDPYATPTPTATSTSTPPATPTPTPTETPTPTQPPTSTATNTPTPTQTPPLGLRSYWTLDQTSGLRLDSSGRGNHLSDNNSVGSASGRVGLAADLESSNNQYLSISDAAQDGLDIAGSLTLVGWMNPESLDGWQVLAAKYEWGTRNRAYRLDIRAPNLLGFIVSPNGWFDDANLVEAQLPFSLSPGTWYYVAAVFNAEQRTLSVYLDGDLVASRSVSYDIIYNSSAPFMLGANLDNGSVTQFFDGQLDEWRVYSRALSASEIEGLMASPASSEAEFGADGHISFWGTICGVMSF